MSRTVRSRKRIGIFLIGVMLVVLLVSMFVGASFELGLWGFRRNLNQSDVSAAQRAARSGLGYVLSRLRNDATWTADTVGPTTVVNDPDLIVVEDRGNIIGLLRNGAQTSQFRARFNYYDGAGGRDGLGMSDPSAAMKIDWQKVCLNNCGGTAAVMVPLANGPGWSVPAVQTDYCDLPARGIFVAVEGRCGSWLSQATALNPNPPLPAGMRASLSHVETVYKIVTPPQGTPAVAGSAGDFLATVGTTSDKDNLGLDTINSSQLPRVRSRGKLIMTGGMATKDNLVAGKSGGSYGALGGVTSYVGVVANSAAQKVDEVANDPLLGVGWSSLSLAAADPIPSKNVLPAGVYSIWQDGNYHYYDMDLAGYRALMAVDPANPGVVNPVLPNSVKYSASGSGTGLKAEFKIEQSTYVNATLATADLTIIPKIGVDGGPGMVDPNLQQIAAVTDVTRADNIKVKFKPTTKDAAVVTSTGKVNLGAKVEGDGGSITAENDLNVVCLGVDLAAYSNPKEGVSLYTKKNLLMSTYDDNGSGSYKKVALKGVMYAWGDIKMKLGDASVPENKWGKFNLTGAMVAYGKDPSDLVTVAAPAKIDLTAKEVNFKYDESYVQGILSGVPATFQLQRVRWLQD